MHIVLTAGAAKDLGRALRLIRHTRQVTLRDAAKAASLSPQYINNIERGERLTVSQEAFARLATALGGPIEVYDDLALKARIDSALEERGLDAEARTFVWRGVEQRLAERGVRLSVLAEALVEMMR
jgi:transcriptional regulator with XRE-family HTH domain